MGKLIFVFAITYTIISLYSLSMYGLIKASEQQPLQEIMASDSGMFSFYSMTGSTMHIISFTTLIIIGFTLFQNLLFPYKKDGIYEVFYKGETVGKYKFLGHSKKTLKPWVDLSTNTHYHTLNITHDKCKLIATE